MSGEFSIKYSGLKDGEYHFDYHLNNTFFADFSQSPIQKADIKIGVDFEKKSSHFQLNFSVSGSLKTECDRCLEEVEAKLDGNFTLYVKFYPHDLDKPEDRIDVMYLPDSEIRLDLKQLLYEYANLSVPLKKIHLEGEAGFEKCMETFNLGNKEVANETDESKEIDPRWAALNKLKTD